MDSTALAVADGLFEGSGDGTRLLASRCAGCGSCYFPRALSCRNPACLDKRLQDTRLGPLGTVHSFTVQRYKPPALFRWEHWAPYALGLIELPEGLRIMGMLTGEPPGRDCIGQTVRLVTTELYHDEQGQAVCTYAWRLLGAGLGAGVGA